MPLVYLRDSISDPLLSLLCPVVWLIIHFRINLVDNKLEVEPEAATLLSALQVDVGWVQFDFVYPDASLCKLLLALVDQEASMHLFNLGHKRIL